MKDNGIYLPLTPTELLIAEHLRNGLTPRAIAGMLCRSINTVRSHIRSIHKKLGVHNTAGIIKWMNEMDDVNQSRQWALNVV